MMMKLFCAVIAITTISTTVQAAETCHPGYYCVRMFEAPAEDPNVAWAREENARQRVEAERSSALRRERIDRLDSEWNAYLAGRRPGAHDPRNRSLLSTVAATRISGRSTPDRSRPAKLVGEPIGFTREDDGAVVPLSLVTKRVEVRLPARVVNPLDVLLVRFAF
ncbi:hypothetical protein [Methylorubrum aminovorans]|uniref:hypothetical protein n=1 Tax=Methylorubrum aminovorans TaxID=269069 RepID=UPI0024E0F5E9|nr:hypothetical protein [Methylorubrum aminovorans]